MQKPADDSQGAPRAQTLFIYRPTGRAAPPSWVSPEVTRYLPAIGCIIIPLIALLLYQFTVIPLNGHVNIPPADIVNPQCPTPAADHSPPASTQVAGIELEGANVAGRLSFGTSSGLLRILSVVGVVFGGFVIARRTTAIIGLLTIVFGLALGIAGSAYLNSHSEHLGTRPILVNPIIEAEQKANVDGMVATKEDVDHVVVTNTILGFTAIIFIFCALGVVAIRAHHEELTPAVLRQRLFDLRWLMIVAATILVLTVVVAHALIDWQVSFLCAAYRSGAQSAGSALANYWGTGGSAVLLGALLPSYFSWSRDVVKWAENTKPNTTEKERDELVASEGLDFAPSASVSAIFTVAVPALSGPLLELLKALPGLSAH